MQVFSKKKVFKIFFQAISKKNGLEKNFSADLQNFNHSKNSAVLEARTGQFSRTWGFEAKAKDFKMCPRGLHFCLIDLLSVYNNSPTIVSKKRGLSSLLGRQQSWAPATRKVAALPLPLFGKKSSGAAAYCYSNKKVVPLPLLACKTAAAAATLKKNSTKNDGIQIRYLTVKFQLYLPKLIIQAF